MLCLYRSAAPADNDASRPLERAMPLPHTLLALTVALIWGFNFLVIAVGLQWFPPLLFAALRFAAAALPAVALVPLPWGDRRTLVAVGIYIGVLEFALLHVAMDWGLSAGLASLLLQTQAFFTVLLARPLMGESPTRHQWLGLGLAALGVLAFAADLDGTFTATGLALVLLAALAWARGNIELRRLGRGNGFGFIVWMSLVPVLPLMALSACFEAPLAALTAVLALPPAELGLALGSVAYMGWLSTVLALGVWGWLLGRYPAARVVPFALLVPVVGMGAAAGLLGEAYGPLRLTGAALILAGLSVHLLGPRRYPSFATTTPTPGENRP